MTTRQIKIFIKILSMLSTYFNNKKYTIYESTCMIFYAITLSLNMGLPVNYIPISTVSRSLYLHISG